MRSLTAIANSAKNSASTIGDLTVAYGGRLAVFDEVRHQIEGDLAKAESIAVPITLVLLLFVFGSVVAASLPLVVGIVSIVGTFLVLSSDRVDHRRVDLLPQPHHRARASAWRSTTACSSSRGSARSCAAGHDGRGRRGPHGRDRRARRSRSAPSPSPSRSARCWCSRCTSCARSPTPASPWSLVAVLASIVSLPALLAVLGHRGRRAGDLGRAATAERRRPRLLAPPRHLR